MVAIFGLLRCGGGPVAGGGQKFAEFIASPSLIDLPLPAYQIRPEILLIELTVSLLVPILAALPAIWKGTRVTVFAALNSTGLSQENLSNSLLERLIERIHFMTGPWLLSLGNILRNRGPGGTDAGHTGAGRGRCLSVCSVWALRLRRR